MSITYPYKFSDWYGYDKDCTPVSTPSITTDNATQISSSGMRLNGNMSSNGGATVTAKGFVYSSGLLTNPILGGMGVTNVTVLNPNTTGAYGASIGSLSASTTYYIKAYATNSQGTSYGSVRSAQTTTNYTTRYIAGPFNKNVFACGQQINQVVKFTGTFGNGTTCYDNNLNLMNSSNGGGKWYGGPPASSSGSATSAGYFYIGTNGVVSSYTPLGC